MMKVDVLSFTSAVKQFENFNTSKLGDLIYQRKVLKALSLWTNSVLISNCRASGIAV